jgi:hypothetical protein
VLHSQLERLRKLVTSEAGRGQPQQAAASLDSPLSGKLNWTDMLGKGLDAFKSSIPVFHRRLHRVHHNISRLDNLKLKGMRHRNLKT